MVDFLLAGLLPSLDSLISFLYVVFGLGLVIFFHELGHFAVAKWCDVYVERFSIGLGPILISRKWGETEYAFSAIPFGGYVKMLGQDDMDPSQMTSEQIAADPRAYTSKKVWQRMAIISAGVIMNIITAAIFYAIAFGFGVEQMTSLVGGTVVGRPAWTAGVEPGDRIVSINGDEVRIYEDILLGVALSSGPLDVVLEKRDGSRVELVLDPKMTELRRQIGVGPSVGLTLINDKYGPLARPGFPAEQAEPTFASEDTIVRVDDQELSVPIDLRDYELRHPGQELTYHVRRKPAEGAAASEALTAIRVPPNHFLQFGFSTDIGPIKFLRDNSPAKQAGLKVGDKITRVNGVAVGTDLPAFRLPEVFAAAHGSEVKLEVRREDSGASGEKVGDSSGIVELTVVPEDRPAWSEEPFSSDDSPLPLPAIGAACEVTRTVVSVKRGSPADGKILNGDRIHTVEFLSTKPLAEGEKPPKDNDANTIVFADTENKKKTSDFTTAFWALQSRRHHDVKITITRGKDKHTFEYTPFVDENDAWYNPERGLALRGDSLVTKAHSFGESVTMGTRQTGRKVLEIYAVLRSLFSGELSVKNLHGPIGIAKTAYSVAQHSLIDFLMFLGLLSVNLAVLNFLPIPVLDGGHMVFLIWEGVTGKKPSEKVLAAVTYVGLLFILGLFAMVIYLDLFYHTSK